MSLVIQMVILASGSCCDLVVHPVNDVPFFRLERTGRHRLNVPTNFKRLSGY